MGESFDLLDVMNSVLSLAYNLESYPHHLYKAGYSISRIEPRFNVDGGVNSGKGMLTLFQNLMQELTQTFLTNLLHTIQR